MKTLLTLADDVPKPIRTFEDLFNLYEEPEGRFRAELGTKTRRCETSLKRAMKAGDHFLVESLLALGCREITDLAVHDIPEPKYAIFGGSNITEVYRAGIRAQGVAEMLRLLLLSPLVEAFGADVEILHDRDKTSVQRSKARKNILQKIDDALTFIEKNGAVKRRKNQTLVVMTLSDGRTILQPLGLVALSIAQSLVAEQQELPTKGEVQRLIEKRHPECSELSDTTWLRVWKSAGLENLPHDVPWTRPTPRKRRSTRQKKAQK